MNTLLRLLSDLRMFKVTKWDEDSSGTYSQEEREPASVAEANIVTSLRDDQPGKHALLIDLDIPAWLVPSSTPGHSHLYVDVAIDEAAYFRLLDSLAECGVIQRGYAKSSQGRGGTALRLPWVKKPENSAPRLAKSEPF